MRVFLPDMLNKRLLNGWFPASGARNYGAGGLMSVSTHGPFWSSSPYPGSLPYGSYLDVMSGTVTPRYYGGRASGLSVRCVSGLENFLPNMLNKRLLNNWFPASGVRDYGTGGLVLVSTRGYCWCSSPGSAGSTFSGCLYLNSGSVSLNRSGYRAIGLSVRCVSGLENFLPNMLSERLLYGWFPASGARNYGAGGLMSVSTHGPFWSSSPYPGGLPYGSYLDVLSGTVTPRFSGQRSWAFSVRCVSGLENFLPNMFNKRLLPGWFPASGLRVSKLGNLLNVSAWGLFWSSSPYSAGSTFSGYLLLDSGTVNRNNNGYRAAGQSVRCVSGLENFLPNMFNKRLLYAWFPAAGRRYYVGGSLGIVTSFGLYWSSSPYAGGHPYGSYLDFTSGTVTPRGANGGRAYGLPVRCVSGLENFLPNMLNKRLLHAWFPAAGNRVSKLGNLVSVSSAGFFWSSSPLSLDSARGGSFHFDSGAVTLRDLYGRANGFSVRCVSGLENFLPNMFNKRLLHGWFPASGGRLLGTGGLVTVSTIGYYWSSSPYSAGNKFSGYLVLDSGTVNLANNGYRATGLSVRCVSGLENFLPNMFNKRLLYGWFPASGCRSEGTGGFVNVTTIGYSWSSSPGSANDVFSGYLRLVSGEVIQARNGYRTCGLPVRCVSGLENFLPNMFNKRLLHGWFPASGYRSDSRGGLVYVSTIGYYWSSSPYSAGSEFSGDFRLVSGTVYQSGYGYRASGLIVRCVSGLENFLPNMFNEWLLNNWFPAAGGRSVGYGVFVNVSSIGYYWSSSPRSGGSTFVGCLNVMSGVVGLDTRGDRAASCSVRCVSGLGNFLPNMFNKWLLNNWFPASGFRRSDYGSLWDVSVRGLFWSSSPFSLDRSYASYLNFLSDAINPREYVGRAHGFSVRCVSGLGKFLPNMLNERLLNNWFPASGYRYESTGGLVYVSAVGYYWSSSPRSAGSKFSGFLSMNSGSVSLKVDGYRTCGFSVRCVSGLGKFLPNMFNERLLNNWFPASGYRSAGTGGLAGASAVGYCRSSSPGSSGSGYGSYLFFHSGAVDPRSLNGRALGFSVRCVSGLGEFLPNMFSKRLLPGWFPASGFRHRDSGTLTYTSVWGFYWSSSPDSSGSGLGGCLNFVSDALYPRYARSRAFGFNVRCVSGLGNFLPNMFNKRLLNNWFPASGNRSYNTGGLAGVSTAGYYRSSSPYSSGSGLGGFLHFHNSGTVNLRNGSSRANGFSVRCVSGLGKFLPNMFNERLLHSWFPASGYRSAGTGGLLHASVWGCFWSSSPDSSSSGNGGYFYFSSNRIYLRGSYNRAAGLSVRCVSGLGKFLPNMFSERLLHAWFPASGYRAEATGGLVNVSTFGYFWSSSPYSSGSANGGYLGFRSGAVYPRSTSSRANGFSVRCVSGLEKFLPNMFSKGLLHAWFPASGYRHRDNGSLTNVSVWGLFWSSSPYSSAGGDGGNFWFDSGSVTPRNGTSSRSYAFSVRCVSGLGNFLPNMFSERLLNNWFPASGCRYRTSGSLTNVSVWGLFWSSSPGSSDSGYGGYLYFISGTVYPQFDGYGRSGGFSVRCVSGLGKFLPNMFSKGLLNAWFPASGYRAEATGGLVNVSTFGYFWSSSSFSADSEWGHFFSVNSGSIGQTSGFRACAINVRCVSGLGNFLPNMFSERLLHGWFPASGYRHRDSGSLTNVSVWGLFWSSSPNTSAGGDGGYLYFLSDAISPQGHSGRAASFSVRCVSGLGKFLPDMFSKGLFNAWFPASGARALATGTLSSVSVWGLFWSSSPYSAGSKMGCYLYLDSGTVYLKNNGYRAAGLSVRCVSGLGKFLPNMFSEWLLHAWFPASGRRMYNDGSLFSVTLSGYYRSSSPWLANNMFCGALGLDSETVLLNGNTYRATGTSVRCVSGLETNKRIDENKKEECVCFAIRSGAWFRKEALSQCDKQVQQSTNRLAA